MEEDGESFCPSFNYYSSHRFAEIAAEVTDEKTPLETSTDFDDDFEFAFVHSEADIRQIFPVFNRDLLVRNDLDQSDGMKPTELTLRFPLEKLLLEDDYEEEEEERDPPSSPSSSETDELDHSVPARNYCVWMPKLVEGSASRCRKSKSTGSSLKQWKLRDLLLGRCRSLGKEDSFVLMTPKSREPKAEKQGRVETPKAGKAKAKGVASVGENSSSLSSAHEVFYQRNRAWKEGEKRKSYLPYRKNLVGFSPNVNAFGMTFLSF